MKIKLLFFIISAGVLVFLFAFASGSLNQKDFETAKDDIVMRKIEHQLMLYSGDSTSRILPVKRLANNEYQLSFPGQFTFKPDSIVKIIDRIIASNKIPKDYIVNVTECLNNKVVFGYAKLTSEESSIVPCIGRTQPGSCYYINIKFKDESMIASQKKYYFIGLSILIAGLTFHAMSRYSKKNITHTKEDFVPAPDEGLQIGNSVFYNDKQYICIGEQKVSLTVKETKLMSIFATAPNEVVDRSRLQKEVWEDEGVIVGRSLDVFISKLRKKLEPDPSLKLSNIHSRGYKLEIVKNEV